MHYENLSGHPHGGMSISFRMLKSSLPGEIHTMWHRPRVLVAGAEPQAQEIIQRLLPPCDASVEFSPNVTDGLTRLESHSQDLLVVCLDSNSYAEYELPTRSKHNYPWTPIIGLVKPGDVSAAVRVMKAGAADCLEISAQAVELQAAISELLRRRYPNVRSGDLWLTKTESLVLAHILEGRTNLAVAQVLHRSHRTIEVHRRAIMRKLRVSNIVDLLKRAISLGLVPANPPRAQNEDAGIAEA